MSDPISILAPQEIANDSTVRVVSLVQTNGQWVKSGERVAEIETSKSTVEITAPADGWVEPCCKAGDDIPIGAIIARLHATQESLAAPRAPAAAVADAAASTTARQTIFSDAARRQIEAQGLNPDSFQGCGFIRERDITGAQAEVGPTAQPVAPVAAQPFQQTFCADWPWHRLLKADLIRINGADDRAEFIRQWWENPAFCYIIWFRIAQAARLHPVARLLVYPFAKWLMMRAHYRTGIRIPLSVKAGPGLMIGHWGAVWINRGCSFGANCTISNDINIGGAGGSEKRGVPQMGDGVYIGPGARLSEPITIAQEAAVMANTLVTTDLPPGAVALGVPHRVTGFQTHNRYCSNRCKLTASPTKA